MGESSSMSMNAPDVSAGATVSNSFLSGYSKNDGETSHAMESESIQMLSKCSKSISSFGEQTDVTLVNALDNNNLVVHQ
ncbi:hypothetical protein CUMW_220620 [Citrus unshiu]|uniref:Uncharacterized protein n=1 Tax=Citrus unshiu TaxID=55188 RepID=A0A2H5QDY3_CITUN|nr:hypothetical protein CUMW_220620 [Citrus unshiu]